MKTRTIYLANLSAYTKGLHIGREIELPIDPIKLKEIKEDLLKQGGGEEFIILDSDKDLCMKEYSNVEEYNDLLLFAQKIDKLDDALALLNFDLWVTPDDVITYLEDEGYRIIDAANETELGEYLVNEDILEESEKIKSLPEHWVDFEAIGRDYSINNNATEWNKKYIFLIG